MATKKRNLQVRDGERQLRNHGQTTGNGNETGKEIKGRALDRLLFPNEFKRQSNDIPTSCAQSPTKFLQVGAPGLDSARNQLERIASNELYRPMQCALYLLASGRTRISQLLNVTYADISRFGDIVIKGAKGSNPVVITDSRVKDYLLDCKVNRINPFAEYNRFTIYRYLQKHSFYYKQTGNRNKSVTHAARYDAVQAIDETTVGREASKLHLGHKSDRSTAHYGKNKR